jgi:putative SOS response-associated peptidase YedK
MCGRVAMFTPPARLARLLEASLAAGVNPEAPPHWNIGPQRTLFALDERDGERVLDSYRWGLLPSWAKDPSISNRLFNARAETVREKPSFRSAFTKRPCVVAVDGFYEWDHRDGRQKQPHFFSRVDGEPLLFAGLFEYPVQREPASDAPAMATCTVITTTPNADMDSIHDRMPVVIERDAIDLWLDVDEHQRELRYELLRPAAPGTLTHYGVSTAVGNVRNNGPELIEKAESTSLF